MSRLSDARKITAAIDNSDGAIAKSLDLTLDLTKLSVSGVSDTVGSPKD
jgi:hypothetical protein